MNILIVEPDFVLANIYKSYLESNGMSVCLAYDAESTIQILDENRFDMLVVEIQLSEHNGLEIIHEIRTYPEWDILPILINSLVNPDTINKSIKIIKSLGVVDYLYKPSTSLAELHTAITQTLVKTS